MLYCIGLDPYTVTQVRRALAPLQGPQVIGVSRSELAALGGVPGVERSQRILFLVAGELIPDLPASLRAHILIACGPGEMGDHIDPGAADDFIATPWSEPELRFRVRKHLSHRRLSSSGGTLTWGAFWLQGEDPAGGTIRVSLSPREYQTLDVIIRAAGSLVEREVLGAVLEMPISSSRSLDMQVSRARIKLNAVSGEWEPPPVIASRRGKGYYLRRQ